MSLALFSPPHCLLGTYENGDDVRSSSSAGTLLRLASVRGRKVNSVVLENTFRDFPPGLLSLRRTLPPPPPASASGVVILPQRFPPPGSPCAKPRSGFGHAARLSLILVPSRLWPGASGASATLEKKAGLKEGLRAAVWFLFAPKSVR